MPRSPRDPAPPSVLQAIHWDRRGGAERVVETLLRSLDGERRTGLALAVPAPEGSRRVRWDGERHDARELLFGRWDVLHTHLFLPGLLARVRRLWDRRTRWVHTVHYDNYDLLRLGALRRWLDHRWVFPAADALTAVSPHVAGGLPPGLAVEVVENPVELPGNEGSAGTAGGSAPSGTDPRGRVASGAAARGPSDRPGGGENAGGGRGPSDPGPVFGTVALLRPEKGVEDLVDAFALLLERLPRARLRVAGDGPLLESLRARVGERGIGPSVEMPGWVEDLTAFYRSLDVYVQPSHHESFGLAALDALGHGLPVVATDAGNLPRLLGGGRWGTVVRRTGDLRAALASAMAAAWEERALWAERAAEGGRHWREAGPSAAAVVERYRRLYRRVSGGAVCMIAPVVTHSPGGLQRQLLLQSRELVRRGWRVFVLQRRDRRLADPERAAEWRHVRVLSTPDPGRFHESPSPLATRLRGLVFTVAARRTLARWRHQVAVLHAHQLYSPTLVGAWAKRRFGLPLVVKVTASGFLGEAGQIRRLPFRRASRRAFRRVDRALVLSEEMRREVEGLGFPPSRVELVPNAVEIPARAVPGPGPLRGPLRLLYAGRLSSEKLPGSLLDAADLVAGRRGAGAVEVHLVGGPAPARDVSAELEERAAALRDRVEVVFHGQVADVDPHYRACDAFVLPSRSEGMSNALLEAMARGVVCVASDIPPNRWALDDGRAGLLFPPGDAAALAERIEELLDDRRAGGRRSAELGRRARRRARERFSVEAVVDRIEEVYVEVGAERGGAR